MFPVLDMRCNQMGHTRVITSLNALITVRVAGKCMRAAIKIVNMM
jgi:hypothetical protein